MDDPDIPEPGKSGFHAVRVVHLFLPLFAGIYYFLCTIIEPARRVRQEAARRRLPQSIALWSMRIILVTYILDLIVLIYPSFPRKTLVLPYNTVYALSSVLLWLALIQDFSWQHPFPCLSLGGCSVLYLLSEVFLLASSLHPDVGKPLSIALSIIWELRIMVIVLLASIAAGSQRIPLRRRRGEEEARPLLRDDTTHSSNEPRGNNEGIYYGTTALEQSTQLQSEEYKRESTHLSGRFMFFAPFFWPQNRPFLQLLYGGIGFCLMIERALVVLIPLQLGHIVNILIQSHGTLPRKEIILFVILWLLDSSGGISLVRKLMWLPLESHFYLKIGTSLYDKLMTLSSDFHDQRNPASLWESVGQGFAVRYAIRSLVFQIMPVTIDLMLFVIMLLRMFGVYMAVIFAMTIILLLLVSQKTLSKLQDKQRQLIYDIEKEHNILCESTTNWRTALYFGRLPYEKARFHSAITEHMNSSFNFFLWSQFECVAQSFLLASALSGLSLLASNQIFTEKRPVGDFVVLVIYWAQVSSPLQLFASRIRDIALGFDNAAELMRILNSVPSISNKCAAKPLVFDQGKVEFNDVSFTYDGQRNVLNKINFQASVGQTVAFVGETGSGKSSIVKLLLRMYDPTRGAIRIDGQDIRNVTLESLRASIGVVPQDPALLNDTIMNNIRYANMSATEEEIYEACKAVALHDLFISFKYGYQTLLGVHGVKISGGELQRVAIARAIIRDPKIIILDEATNSVDGYTGSIIRKSLKKLCAGRITFVISHLLSTVTSADKIVVLRHGNVAEQGCHDSLLSMNGYYSCLWSHQVRARHHSVTTSSSTNRRLQQVVGLYDSKEEVKVPKMDDPTVSENLRRLTDDLQMLKTAKSRLKRTHKRAKFQVTNSQKENHSAESPENGNSGGILSTRKCMWKPDAPEFVPVSQQRALGKYPKVMEDQSGIYQHYAASQHFSEEDQVGEGNSSQAFDTMTGNENAVWSSINNENGPPGPATSQKNQRYVEDKSNRQTASVLQQTNNGVVLAYPKKARKKAKGSRKGPNGRRKRTESEPAGIGLKPELY